MEHIRQTLFILLISAGIALQAHASEDSGLLRFPDINGDLVAFVYAGDIWTVSADGGDARRLTSHIGLELFPKISPNGKWIAFSGQYGGNRQVFVIPSEGGVPKQLTWYNPVGEMPPRGGFNNVVLDWTPDSKKILFRSNRTEFGQRNGKYYTVGMDGSMEEPLPIVHGGIGTFSPDATKLCFTPVSREFRSWKRYKGGRATELWIYDLKKNTSEKMTDFAGSDQWPVWEGDDIYFVSDRDLTLNVYQYNTQTKDIRQITHFSDYDVLWPSGQNGQLVFENGGFLHKTNMETGETEKITINIHFDNPNRVPYFKNVKEHIHSFAISPTGKRALFDARGDIYSVPAENGITENLTETQGVREIYPSWSPNGKYIAYYSDATGEYEIYLLENKEGARPEQVTSGSSAWKYDNEWSPDSKYLLYSDRTLNLKLFDVGSRKETIITQGAETEIRSYSFSPDSKWVVYDKETENGQSAVWVYDIEEKKNHQLSGKIFSDFSPVFSTDGNYIFFLSNRDFNLKFSDFEFNYIYNDATRIYAMTLKKDGPELFKRENDVEPVKEEDADDEKKSDNTGEEENNEKEGKTEPETVTVEINMEDIADRVVALPPKAGNYRNLSAVKGGLLYIHQGKLFKYVIKDEESTEILSKVTQVLVSSNREMMLYRSGDDYGITAIKPGIKPGTGKLDLKDLEMKIDPVKEWIQIYNDGWRIFRDYFYVENLHGVDWEGMKRKYSKWLPYLGHRVDLDYILSEMVAESNAGHAYVNRGDYEHVKRIESGLLGAQLVADSKADRYKIDRIYDSENWNKSRRSPLTELGVDVSEGDYLLSINGEDIRVSENAYRFLENKAGDLLEITVSAQPDGSGARKSLIEPVDSELELKYLDWVNERRQMVDKLSGGRIGYIHVPNTSFEGNRELYRGMYAYHNKEALIIDDRYNGGGFIPNIMTELLDRKTLSYWKRGGLDPMRTPGIAHDGPKVMLINGYSSSGGDALPYFFRKKGLGKLIGTRTWGGLIGISGNAVLVDGGSISVPRFGIYNEKGEWIIEGVGVYPDIKVVDRPEELAKGNDPGIEKAVEVLLEQLRENPAEKVEPPTPPDRSGWIEEDIE